MKRQAIIALTRTSQLLDSPCNTLMTVISVTSGAPQMFMVRRNLPAQQLHPNLTTGFKLVDNQTLPNTSKLWLYQHFIIPKLSWYLTALDLTLTFVKRLQAKATKYLKKWSGLPRSANTAILFLGKSGRAGLHIPSIVTYWKQMQLVRLDILKHSADVRCCRLYDNLLQRQSTWSRKFPAAVEHACATTVVEANPTPASPQNLLTSESESRSFAETSIRPTATLDLGVRRRH